MKLNSCLLLALLAVAIVPLKAVTLTFESASEYSNNFTPGFTSNTGGGGTPIFWSTSTYPNHLVKYDATGSGSASFSIFNTAAASTSYTLKADALFNPTSGFSTSALSFGFVTNIGTNNGYAAIFRLTSNTTADFRIFEGVNASTGAIGTEINNQTFTLSSGTWSTTSFYTLNLNVVNTGTSISFTGSILTTGGTTLGAFNTYTDTTPSSVLNTSVGIRMGIGASDVLRMDNFTVPTSAIPEPSTYALFGGAGMLVLSLYTRRKRS